MRMCSFRPYIATDSKWCICQNHKFSNTLHAQSEWVSGKKCIYLIWWWLGWELKNEHQQRVRIATMVWKYDFRFSPNEIEPKNTCINRLQCELASSMCPKTTTCLNMSLETFGRSRTQLTDQSKHGAVRAGHLLFFLKKHEYMQHVCLTRQHMLARFRN